MHNEVRQVLDFLDSVTKSFARGMNHNEGIYEDTGARLTTGAFAALVHLGIQFSADLKKIADHLDSIQDSLSDLADSIAVIETRKEQDQ